MVTNELRGEKVDIVPFSDDPAEFVQTALQPARVREVRLDEETGTATVIVHDFQLSLAIGKEGQNARLAARLTGWRIDIKSETQLAEEEAGYGAEDWAEGEWVEDESGEMVLQPAGGGEAISVEEWSTGRRTRRRSRRRSGRAGDADGERPPAASRGGRRRGGRRAERPSARGSRGVAEAAAGATGEADGIAPDRTCVGCRDAAPADAADPVAVGPTAARDRPAGPGRGAWLCDGRWRASNGAAAAAFARALRGRSRPRRSSARVSCSVRLAGARWPSVRG